MQNSKYLKIIWIVLINYLVITLQISFDSLFLLPIIIIVFIFSVLTLGNQFIIGILFLYFPFYLFDFDLGFISIKLFEILIIISFMMIVLSKKSFKIRSSNYVILYPYLILITLSLFSLYKSPNIYFSLSVFFVLIFPILIYLIGINSIRNNNDIKVTIMLASLSGLVQSLIIIYQYLTFDSFLIYYGLQGTMGNSNRVASFLLVTIFLSFAIKDKNKTSSVIFALLILTQFFALLLTKSRGAWVSFLMIFAFMLAYYIYKSKNVKTFFKTITITLLLGFSIYIILPSETIQLLYDQFNSIFDLNNRSNSDRIYMWKSAIDMFSENPLFGKGVGNFYNLYPNYRYIGADLQFTSAHSNYFMLIAENGLIGTILYILFLLHITHRVFKQKLNKHESFVRMFIFFSWLTFLVQGLTDHNMYVVRSASSFWMVLVLIILYRKENGNEKANNKLFQRTSAIN